MFSRTASHSLSLEKAQLNPFHSDCKIVNIILSTNFNICFGYSKELSPKLVFFMFFTLILGDNFVIIDFSKLCSR